MKLTTVKNNKRPGALRPGPASAFTLAECLVAMIFLAIVLPVAVEAFHVASGAGTIAVRKAEAARIAQRVLNQSLVMTNWQTGSQSGTMGEGADEFRYSLSSASWQQDAMKLLTAEVTFNTQGRDYSVRLSTLASPPSQASGSATTGLTP